MSARTFPHGERARRIIRAWRQLREERRRRPHTHLPLPTPATRSTRS